MVLIHDATTPGYWEEGYHIYIYIYLLSIYICTYIYICICQEARASDSQASDLKIQFCANDPNEQQADRPANQPARKNNAQLHAA